MKTKTKNRDCPLIRGLDDRMVKPFDGWLRTEAQDFCLNNCPYRECLEVLHDRKERHKLTHAECGKLGGLATAKKYRHDQVVEWGRKGGRAYALTFAGTYHQIRQSTVLEVDQHRNKNSNGHKQIQDGARGDLIASGSGRSGN